MMNSEQYRLSRRTLLTSTPIAMAATAGCSRVGLWRIDPFADVEVTNDADKPYLVTVAVTGSEIDGENKQEDAVMAGETVTFEDLVPQSASEYSFQAEFQLDREVVHRESYVIGHQRDTFHFRITPEETIEAAFDPDELGS